MSSRHLLSRTRSWLLPTRLLAPVHEIPDAEESFLHLLHLLDGFPGCSLGAEWHQRGCRDVPSLVPGRRSPGADGIHQAA